MCFENFMHGQGHSFLPAVHHSLLLFVLDQLKALLAQTDHM